MLKAVFLDRDGVINKPLLKEQRPYPPANLIDLEILPKVDLALKNLREFGYLIIVITNQLKDYNKFIKTRLPRKKMGSVNEILPMLLFLCSKHSSMMGGCLVPIDAGEGKAYQT